MKPSVFFLSFYFFVAASVVFLQSIEMNASGQFLKNVVCIPVLFVYYQVTKKVKLSLLKGLVFLFCFVAETFDYFFAFETVIVGLLSFLLVYLLLFLIALPDYKKLKFYKEDYYVVLVVKALLILIVFTVFSLEFENLNIDFSFFGIYTCSLILLSFIAIVNYIKDDNKISLYLMLMCFSFVTSDVFFMFYHFYLNLIPFIVVNSIAQFFAYFFMVRYFIERDKQECV